MAIDESSQHELFDFDAAFETGVVPPEAEEETRVSAQVVDALVKAIKAYRYYAADHPQLEQFRHALLSRFHRYFAQATQLILEVSELAFIVDGQPVSSAHDLHSSVPFLLYRDGVRLLRFHDTLDDDELLAFVQLIAGSDHANQLEDDLVTLLWEQEFSAITFVAADYLPADLPIAVPETLEQFCAALNATLDAHPQQVHDTEQPEIGHPELPPLQINDAGIFRLTPEEVETLRREVERTIGPEKMLGYTDLLFDALPLQDDPALFGQLTRILQETLESQLISGRLARACDLLERLSALMRALPAESWKLAPLAQVPAAVAKTAGINLIARSVESGEASAEMARRLLLALPAAATPHVARVLGDVGDVDMRALLRDVLTARCRGALSAITPFLEDPRDALVCDIIQVLGALGDVSCLSMLARVFAARGVSVRKAVLEAVSTMDDPGVEALLLRALKDAQSEIRCRAAVLLGLRHTPTALEALLAVVTDKRFILRPAAEMRAMLEGLGRTGMNDAVEVLEHLTLQKPWLGRKKADSMRPYAAQALALLGTPEALVVLEAGSVDDDEGVRGACRTAMKHARKGAPA
jgi:hypothetical protein